MISSKRLAACAAITAVASLALVATASARTLVVNPGHSIQAKIDRADAGDTVLVRAGVYRQALEINKRLHLQGQGAVLTGDRPGGSLCNRQPGPDNVGICVHGKLKFSGPGGPQLVRRVEGVEISGFRVRGFSAEGVFAFGTQGMRVHNNRFGHNGGYGLFSLLGNHVHLTHNVARGNGEPGLYVGDSPRARAEIRGNRSVGNGGEGILLRHASIGVVRHNVLAHNCIGMMVLADAPGPAGNFTISGNRVVNNNKACKGDPDEGLPPMSGVGIALLGAHDTVVKNNVVRGQNAAHASFIHGGIVVGKGVRGTPPQADRLFGNVALGNHPDISWDGSGHVRFGSNLCRTSRPKGVC